MAKGKSGGKYAKSVSTEKKLTAADFSVGERVGIAPNYRDNGEGDDTAYKVIAINGDRIVIQDYMSNMALKPTQTVSANMLEKKNFSNVTEFNVSLNQNGEIKFTPKNAVAEVPLSRKDIAERRRIAQTMRKQGSIHKAVFDDLKMYDFSDEAIDRAVERGWIKDYQARSIRSKRK